MKKEQKIAKVVQKFAIDQQPKERSYWMTRTPEERLGALEAIRNEYHNEHESQPKLQRVYRIIEQESG